MSWKTVPCNRKWAWRKFVSRGWARIPGAGSLERFVYSFLRRRMAADWAIVHCREELLMLMLMLMLMMMTEVRR